MAKSKAKSEVNSLIDEAALTKAKAEIMENFRFGRVKKAMRVLNWQWCNHTDGAYYKPKKRDLKESALSLINESIDYALTGSGKCRSATGGFEVRVNLRGPFPDIQLNFILEGWENFYDEE